MTVKPAIRHGDRLLIESLTDADKETILAFPKFDLTLSPVPLARLLQLGVVKLKTGSQPRVTRKGERLHHILKANQCTAPS